VVYEQEAVLREEPKQLQIDLTQSGLVRRASARVRVR
jgi:hypothetical protein